MEEKDYIELLRTISKDKKRLKTKEYKTLKDYILLLANIHIGDIIIDNECSIMVEEIHFLSSNDELILEGKPLKRNGEPYKNRDNYKMKLNRIVSLNGELFDGRKIMNRFLQVKYECYHV